MFEITLVGEGNKSDSPELQHADIVKEYKEGFVPGDLVCVHIRNYWIVFIFRYLKIFYRR